MAIDTIGLLQRRGQIEVDEGGGLRFRGVANRVYRWLDERLVQLMTRAGASPLEVSATIDRDTLARAEYFDSFADVAIRASSESEVFLPPAACYYVYPRLQGRLDGPRTLTVSASCGRVEERTKEDAGRLRRFHMREAVFVGTREWVSFERNAWVDRARSLAAEIGLSGAMEPATDMFFGGMARGRRLLQQVKNLKYELRADAGSAGTLAIASFNLHESFFTTRFEIGPMPDGAAAASGCAAFGLERWTLACLAQLGPERAAALFERGVPRFTTST